MLCLFRGLSVCVDVPWPLWGLFAVLSSKFANVALSVCSDIYIWCLRLEAGVTAFQFRISVSHFSFAFQFLPRSRSDRIVNCVSLGSCCCRLCLVKCESHVCRTGIVGGFLSFRKAQLVMCLCCCCLRCMFPVCCWCLLLHTNAVVGKR